MKPQEELEEIIKKEKINCVICHCFFNWDTDR